MSDGKEYPLIIQINCEDSKGVREPAEMIKGFCDRLSKLLSNKGFTDFIIVPKYGSLMELNVVKVTETTPCFIINCDGSLVDFSFEDLRLYINQKLRERSDTEDGKL